MRRLILAAMVVATCGGIIAACARPAAPPGGPPRSLPPKLLGVFPDTNAAIPGMRGDAVFRFDEVISEGQRPNYGLGTGDLEKLIVFSPDTIVPVVGWRRDRIVVHPRGGWKPNTVYRIELQPGVADLHNNAMKGSSVITVTTGGAVPTRFLTGRVIDWRAVRGVGQALVTAFHLPDSAGYRTVADSTGRFRLGPLPAGQYLVEGVLDVDRNHKRNKAEGWDTVRVDATHDAVGEIWAFVRDTSRLRATDQQRRDSVTIELTVSNLVDPGFQVAADSVRVGLLPDTFSVGPIGAYSRARADSLFPAPIPVKPVPKTKADSTKQRTADSLAGEKRISDSLAKASAARAAARSGRAAAGPDLPQQKRLALTDKVEVRTRGFIQPGHKYFIEVRGVHTAAGRYETVRAVLDVPAQKVDSLKTHADSLRADSLNNRPGVLKTRADTLHADSLRSRLTGRGGGG